MVFLYYVRFNQIRTVFDPEYVRVESLEGYNRIAQYYLRPGDYNTDDDDDDGSESDITIYS